MNQTIPARTASTEDRKIVEIAGHGLVVAWDETAGILNADRVPASAALVMTSEEAAYLVAQGGKYGFKAKVLTEKAPAGKVRIFPVNRPA